MDEGKTVEEILKERGASYGDSWLSPTRAIEAITGGDLTLLNPLMESGLLFNWIQILGKICRAVYSPELIDNWRDSAGYAQISVDSLEGKRKTKI